MVSSKSKWMGITGFICSLVAFSILVLSPLETGQTYLLSLVFIILSLIFGLIVIYKDKLSKKLALTGIIISLAILVLIFVGYVMTINTQELLNNFNTPI